MKITRRDFFNDTFTTYEDVEGVISHPDGTEEMYSRVGAREHWIKEKPQPWFLINFPHEPRIVEGSVVTLLDNGETILKLIDVAKMFFDDVNSDRVELLGYEVECLERMRVSDTNTEDGR